MVRLRANATLKRQTPASENERKGQWEGEKASPFFPFPPFFAPPLLIIIHTILAHSDWGRGRSRTTITSRNTIHNFPSFP